MTEGSSPQQKEAKTSTAQLIHELWKSKILQVAIVLFFVGLIGYCGLTLTGATRSKFTLDSNSINRQSFVEKPIHIWADPLANLSLTLCMLGAVSIVFEILNYRYRDEEISAAIEQAGSGLGEKITEDVLHLLVSDREFIQNLSVEQRTDLLRCLILSNLNNDAYELAASTATQLSGEVRFYNFTVNYVARDNQENGLSLPSEVTISYQTNRLPDSFGIRFWAIPKKEKTQPFEELNVGQYYYPANSQEDSESILNNFCLESVTIDNTKDAEISASDNSQPYSRKYTAKLPVANHEGLFKVSYVMTWPKPNKNDIFNFVPSLLSHGMQVFCDFTASSLRALPTQPDSSVTWININPPAVVHPTKIGFQTNDWVLPKTSCGFFFVSKDT